MSTLPNDLDQGPHTHMQTIQSGHIWLDPVQGLTRSDSGRREYACTLISPGYIKKADGTDSNIFIPAKTLRLAADKFAAKPVYLDHPELFGFGWRQAPQVKALAGITFDASWSDEDQEIIGAIRLYDEDPNSPGHFIGILLDQILADKTAGREVPPTGLSAVMFVKRERDQDSGDTVFTEVRHVESVDFVYSPGAAGYVRAALSAAGWSPPRLLSIPFTIGGDSPPNPVLVVQDQCPNGGNEMPETLQVNDGGSNDTPTPPHRTGPSGTVPAASEPIGLADAVARIEQIAAQMNARLQPAPVSDGPTPDIEALAARVESVSRVVENLAEVLATEEQERTIQGMGQPVMYGGFTGFDQVKIALEALIAGVRPPDGIRPLTGIREAYHLLSGDYEMTGMFQQDNVYLAAVTTTTMAGLVANAMNKRVINLYQEYDQWWAPAVTIEDFSSLQDVRWITLGGVGELPTVAEGAAYTEMTWDDMTETDAFVKKGGYLGITLETIDKDDTRKVQAAPRALAQAAWMTLGKSISAIFTTATGTGPTMSDSVVLFHAVSHGNLLTTALSWAEYEVVKVAMMKQTELNSGERLGALTRPYFLWVPIDLETTALQIMASEGEPGVADNDINPLAQGEGREARLAVARRRVIVCPFWTETDHWAAQADPRLYPSIGLGFRYGRTPEIFSVASPTAGLMFSNDTLPVKVRFFYAVGPTDYRGLHKSNV